MNGKICITMNVVDEFNLVKASMSQIHKAYPNSLIVLFVDTEKGEVYNQWQLFADSKTQVRQAFGIYQIDRGGIVVGVHLRSFLATNADWWIKIDPDTFVRRPLVSAMKPNCFFGTLQTGLPRPSLQGGCIGGGRAAASRLLDSGVLFSQDLLDYERTWAAGNGVLLRRARELGLVSFDFVHAWACERVGIPLVNHPEIKSLWLRPPRHGNQYAITHPHKNPDMFGTTTPGESEERDQTLTLQALLRTTLPTKSVIALVSEYKSFVLTDKEKIVRSILLRKVPATQKPDPTDSDEAIHRVRVAREQGAKFLVIPASSRSLFSYYRGFATYIINHYEVIFWQDDLALIFDLERPSLQGPHIDWYW